MSVDCIGPKASITVWGETFEYSVYCAYLMELILIVFIVALLRSPWGVTFS
jgi:hypothetical protein